MTDRFADDPIDLDLDLDEPYDSRWDDWDEPPDERMPRTRRPRVTHLVLVDGLPADHWVDESVDGAWSPSGHPARARDGLAWADYDPPHVRELRWLDSLVGGREGLLALDTAPLVAPSSLTLPPALADQAGRAEAIRLACAQHAAALFADTEMPAATHFALEALIGADPAWLSRSDRDDTAIGGLVWLTGHANGLIGPSGDLLARDLWSRMGVASSAASRGATMLQRLRSAAPATAVLAWSYEEAPAGAPRLKATGHPSLLTSSTRRLLVARRDAALTVAGRES
jgi:hypothetical protein